MTSHEETGRSQMIARQKRTALRMLAQLGVVVFIADTIIGGLLSRLAVASGLRPALDAALVAFACAPLIWWRMRALLRDTVSADATKFRSLLDAAPEGIIGVSEDGRIQFVNAESQRLFQFAESDLLGQCIELLIPDRFSGKHIKARTEFATRPRRRPMGSGLEVTGRRKDGSEFPADVSLSHVRTPKGPLIISIIRDVTAQRQTRNELLEANLKLQSGLAKNLRHTEALRQLSQMGEALQACGTEQESHAVVACYTARMFPEYSGALYMINASRDSIEAAATWGPDAGQLARRFAPSSCKALNRGRLPVATDAQTGAGCEHAGPERNRSTICAPMLARGEVIGVVHLSARPSDAPCGTLDEPHLELLQAITDQVGLSTANLRLREALRLQSICDPLTDLYNRRFMDEWLSRELPRGSRNHRPTSLLSFDLDHFKRFNDTYGHECGDLVLHEVGTLLRGAVRRSDIACRIGGEEFAILLPETTLLDALLIAEKLRARIEALTVNFRDQLLGRITVSIGVAESPRHGSSAPLLMRAADSALYCAKAAGRNRVVAAEDSGLGVATNILSARVSLAEDHRRQ
jgi:diguanylate cyclase (GGDEF)-like protein/PAS domain S-box-containing protein